MRTLIAVTVFVLACGGPKQKKESSIVDEGATTPTCCCKTLPTTAEKEITPVYSQENRMECSAKKGDCVDDVQCNAATPTETQTQSDTGVPAPPQL